MTMATSTELTSKPSFLEIFVITLGHTMTHWYPATFYLLLPLIGKELGLSYGEIGAIMTCQYLAGAISNVPGGLAVDLVSRKTMPMAISMLWVGVPYLLMGLTHTYWLLLVCSALVGVGNNLCIQRQFHSWRSDSPKDEDWRLPFIAWEAILEMR